MGFVTKYEDFLINPIDWEGLYNKMPRECQEIVDSPPDCTGIGYCEELGWFIAASGQGPFICWKENSD